MRLSPNVRRMLKNYISANMQDCEWTDYNSLLKMIYNDVPPPTIFKSDYNQILKDIMRFYVSMSQRNQTMIDIKSDYESYE